METDFIKLIETRRSIRSYKKEPVSEKDLNKILEAGTYARFLKLELMLLQVVEDNRLPLWLLLVLSIVKK